MKALAWSLAPMFVAGLAFVRAPAKDAEAVAALNRALDSVRAERIAADVAYVACDDMGGRDTPSVGQHLTARFIKNRLQRIGWNPGAGKPGAKDPWLYTYSLGFKRMKEPETQAQLAAGSTIVPLTVGTDYFFPMRELGNSETAGSVVFCGKGAKEDFDAATDLKGKWALCVDGGENLRGVEERATPGGAVGVIAIAAAESKAPKYSEQFGRTIAAMRAGRVQPPESGREQRAPTMRRAYLAATAAESLWTLAGTRTPTVGQDLGVVFSDKRRILGDGTVECENVVGFWPGSDAKLSQDVIICSAHYDHVGTTPDGTVYNGADDNGSGTCAMLALAEALVVRGPLRRSVMIIWVSGEEKGLLGSEAWVRAPYFPNDGKAVADINIDMVGRNAGNQILVTPTRVHPAYNGLVKMTEKLAPGEGFTDIQSADEYYTRSDHAMFAKLKIPVTFLFANVHEDYHKPTDDIEKIDSDKIRRVVRLVLRMLEEMQQDELDLTR